MDQNNPSTYYEIEMRLLPGCLPHGLGPLKDDNSPVGFLVEISDELHSGRIIVGRRRIPPGATANVRMLLLTGKLEVDQTVRLLDGPKFIASARVTSIGFGDWQS